MTRTTLRSRLNRILFHWLLLFVIASAVVLYVSSAGLQHDVEEERRLLARTLAGSLDATLSHTLRDVEALERTLVDFGPDDSRRLRAFRFESAFNDAIYVLDGDGTVVASDPPGRVPLGPAALAERHGVTPRLNRSGGDPSAAVAIVHPFRRGAQTYRLVAEMDLQGSMMSRFLRELSAPPDLHLAIVDAGGSVLAAPDPRLLERQLPDAATFGDSVARQRPLLSESFHCGLCPDSGPAPTALTVVYPLRFAPWGILIQEPKASAFAALARTRRGMLVAGVLLAATALLLSRALVRSVASPIGRLSEEAERIRGGDLTTPIAVSGDHEVQVLARTLEEGRTRLAGTLSELQLLNESLEAQVAERTEQIQGKYRDLQLLYAVAQLHKKESEPTGLVRRALRLFVKHSHLRAAVMVIHPQEGPPETVTEPADFVLPASGEESGVPAGWQRRGILHRGRLQADLLVQEGVLVDEEIVAALGNHLAVLLHDATLRRRAIVQEEQRRVLLRRLLGATEEERLRLARELHDETAQLLTAIQLSLEGLPADAVQVVKSKELIKTAQAEIHRIIRDLRPSALHDLGLAAAMKTYAREKLDANGVNVNLEIEEGMPARPEIERVTFRIYQELVTNILRHSKAENVSVELYEDEGKIVLAVEDDGVGFNPDRQRGVGITGMQERASLVGGTLRFDSERGMGTLASVEIPTS